MNSERLSPSAIARAGQRLYEEQIRASVEESRREEFLVIEVHRGDYEVDPEHLRAAERVRARHPDAAFFGIRVGYAAAYRLGCAPSPRPC